MGAVTLKLMVMVNQTETNWQLCLVSAEQSLVNSGEGPSSTRKSSKMKAMMGTLHLELVTKYMY